MGWNGLVWLDRLGWQDLLHKPGSGHNQDLLLQDLYIQREEIILETECLGLLTTLAHTNITARCLIKTISPEFYNPDSTFIPQKYIIGPDANVKTI